MLRFLQLQTLLYSLQIHLVTQVAFSVMSVVMLLGSCRTSVMFIDTYSPTLQCEETIVFHANQQCRASVPQLSPNVTDNCDSDVSLEQDLSVYSLVMLGNTEINVTATDASGNKVMAEFNSN